MTQTGAAVERKRSSVPKPVLVIPSGEGETPPRLIQAKHHELNKSTVCFFFRPWGGGGRPGTLSSSVGEIREPAGTNGMAAKQF